MRGADPGRAPALRACAAGAAGLYSQTDVALLLASRYRDDVSGAFRFVPADAGLIERLIDKAHFQALAERHGLPVPPRSESVCRRKARTRPARPVRGEAEWRVVWPRLGRVRSELLVQQLVPGPESAIESYHAYIDSGGDTAGEFTGRKIRTFPPRYGNSSAVEIVDVPDVAALGRSALSALGVRGVAKVDFKRDDRGRLHLLEINPRFNLWHHPAALAGVYLPAIVDADLTGCTRPRGRRPTRHVTWCAPLLDVRAAHMAGTPAVAWLRWARRCQAISGLAWDDPLPFLRGTLWVAVRRRLAATWRAADVALPLRLGKFVRSLHRRW